MSLRIIGSKHHPDPLVFISAAEPSADHHGASLIRAARRALPSIRFVGIAGPCMVEAGCEPIDDRSRDAAMLLDVARVVWRAMATFRTTDAHLRRYAFDAAVLIDSPMLNLAIAAQAQALGVPVLYYIAPQMWAWGAYRIYKLRHRVDRVAVILPFEEKYFRDQGVTASYVGHPLAEQIAERPTDSAAVEAIRGRGRPVVALLPGSRRQVVRRILPGQLEVAEEIATRFPAAVFVVSIANPQVAPCVVELLANVRTSVSASSDHFGELIEAADLVLVASGTSTLEVAFRQRPMIVMYNSSRVFYHALGRWMIHTPYFSLPNILAGREIVPEFMPYYRSTRPIAERAIDLLCSEDARGRMLDDLKNVVAPFRHGKASERTAGLLMEMLGRPIR